MDFVGLCGAVLADCVRPRRGAPAELLGRDPEDIAADPQATPDEIWELAEWAEEVGQIAAVKHPNCPLDLFYSLAEDWPIEAMQNPSFELILLEDPKRWKTLQRKFVAKWTSQELDRNPKLAHPFEAWCMRRALNQIEPYVVSNESKGILKNVKAVIAVLENNRPQYGKARRLFDAVNSEGEQITNYEEPGTAVERLELAAYYAMFDYLGLYEKDEIHGAAPRCASAISYLYGYVYAKENGLGPFDFFSQIYEHVEDYMDDVDRAQEVLQFEHLVEMIRFREVYTDVKRGYADLFRENFYGPEAKREAYVKGQIKAATAQMQANTKAIARLVSEAPGWGWPDYLAVGVSVGGLVLVVLAPELFIVEGFLVGEGIAAARVASLAEQIALLGSRAKISEVTIQFGKAAAVTATQSQAVKDLAVKLGQSGLEFTTKAVEVVSKVTR